MVGNFSDDGRNARGQPERSTQVLRLTGSGGIIEIFLNTAISTSAGVAAPVPASHVT